MSSSSQGVRRSLVISCFVMQHEPLSRASHMPEAGSRRLGYQLFGVPIICIVMVPPEVAASSSSAPNSAAPTLGTFAAEPPEPVLPPVGDVPPVPLVLCPPTLCVPPDVLEPPALEPPALLAPDPFALPPALGLPEFSGGELDPQPSASPTTEPSTRAEAKAARISDQCPEAPAIAARKPN